MNDFVVGINGTAWEIKIANETELLLNNKKYNYELIPGYGNSYFLKLDNKIFDISYERINTDSYKVFLEGTYFDVTVRTALQERAAKLIESSTSSQHHQIEVKAPMPGLILKVRKKIGDSVEFGESVMILEAMKMENDLKAPAAGTIKNILVNEGSAVEKGAVLFSIS